MPLKLADLVAALPQEGEFEHAGPRNLDAAKSRIAELFATEAGVPAPTHALRRLWAIGGLEAYIALAYFAWWVRGWFENADTHQRRLVETNLRAALRTMRSMVYLRGAVMKLGQSIANFPDRMPAEIVETLSQLHFQAPPMHFSLLREMVRNELGREPEEAFAFFDTRAFAAASLGQVHRARLKTGEEVAVKIQYPGIARAIAADFRNLSALLLPLRLDKDWEMIKAQCDEIRRMLNQEADYELEAEHLRSCRALFDTSDGILVPRVYEEYSSKRVLTMEFLEGPHVDAFMASNPSQDLRNAFGSKLYRASFRTYYAGMNYADPHPGNYIFMADGRLGLVDFGCIWTFNQQEREFLRETESALGDRELCRQLSARAGHLTEADMANPEYMDLLAASSDWVMQPLLGDGAFDFGNPDHLAQGLEIQKRLLINRYTKSDPMWPFMYRTYFGVRAMLYRLRAQVDVKTIHREEAARTTF